MKEGLHPSHITASRPTGNLQRRTETSHPQSKMDGQTFLEATNEAVLLLLRFPNCSAAICVKRVHMGALDFFLSECLHSPMHSLSCCGLGVCPHPTVAPLKLGTTADENSFEAVSSAESKLNLGFVNQAWFCGIQASSETES